jgi:hypothetical protein
LEHTNAKIIRISSTKRPVPLTFRETMPDRWSWQDKCKASGSDNYMTKIILVVPGCRLRDRHVETVHSKTPSLPNKWKKYGKELKWGLEELNISPKLLDIEQETF